MDINIANFFATRLSNEESYVYTAKVKKKDIIEYIDKRNEKEVLILHENLINVQKTILPQFSYFSNKYIDEEDLKNFNEYKYILKKIFTFKNDLKGHDKLHCLRVLLNAIIIAKHEGITNQEMLDCLYMACISHDMARETELEDVQHGGLSYKELPQQIIIARQGKAKELEFIMKYHCIDDSKAKRSVLEFPERVQEELLHILWILKDADALDRIRFGIKALDLNDLRLPISKTMTLSAMQSISGLKL